MLDPGANGQYEIRSRVPRAGDIIIPDRCGCKIGYYAGATPCFYGNLSAIRSLAEDWAARQTKNFLAVSVVLTGSWLIVWMNTFN